MDWFKIMDSMRDDRWESRSGRLDIAADVLAGPQPNHIEGTVHNAGHGGWTMAHIGLKWIMGAFVLWLFAYISTLFPYLGTYDYKKEGMVQTAGGFGAQHMILFKGQTAFIDYTVNSTPGFDGNVLIDIAPWPGINFSPDMRKVSGRAKGRIEIVIPKTGFYTFRHRIGPMAYRQDLAYSVTWGAR